MAAGGIWACRPGPVRRLLFGPYRWYWGGVLWLRLWLRLWLYRLRYGGCTTYTAAARTWMRGRQRLPSLLRRRPRPRSP